MIAVVRAGRARIFVALAALFVNSGCGNSSAPWNTYPGVDGHAAYLPLRGTAHDPTGAAKGTSCEGCHVGGSFREFTCTTCHPPGQTDPIHAGSTAIAGYVTGAVTSADCYRCHPDGAGIAPAMHALKFPIGTASHPALCATCHTDPADRRDPRKLACVSCHEAQGGFAAVHGRVLDYPRPVTAPWCLRCHADSQVDPIAGHGKRAVSGTKGSAAPGDGEHSTHCFTCHTMVPPDPSFGGTAAGVPNRPWAQDWTQARCASCH